MQTDRASSGRASRGLLLAAVLACGGCASGADYERPRLAAPERFLGESAVQSRQATRPADLHTGGGILTTRFSPVLSRKDRKSVGYGKGVSVTVALGGRRLH